MDSRVVLITGCSSGIGRDLARRLAGAGYRVVATARRPETLQDLEAAALKLPLDVQDPASVESAVEQVIAKFGRIDVLVNNAGCGQAGAFEEVSDAALQQVFDVNLFGPARLVRAVVPHMRRQQAGVIVQISSIGGRVSMPLTGTYGAAKFALEAMSDALRLELLPFGIKVVVIEPGTIVTKFEETLRKRADAMLVPADSPYREQYAAMDKLSVGMYATSPGPEVVSAVIQKAIEARSPRARYSVPAGQAIQTQMMRLMPDALRDRLLASVFAIKRR